MAKKSNSSTSRTSSSSNTTVDHDEIRAWAEPRGGTPACVVGTGGGGDAGVLRIEFNADEESLHQIEWKEFFEKFDEQNLALVYQDRTSDGKESRFNKLISRDNARSGASRGGKAGGDSGARRSAGGRGKNLGTASKTRGGAKTKSQEASKSSRGSGRKSASKAQGRSADRKSRAKPSASRGKKAR